MPKHPNKVSKLLEIPKELHKQVNILSNEMGISQHAFILVATREKVDRMLEKK